VEEIKRRKMHLHSNDDRSIALALKAGNYLID